MSALSSWQDDLKRIEQEINDGFERRARVELLEGLLRDVRDTVHTDALVGDELMARIRDAVGSELQ